jgi:hypothetical protein
MPAVGGAIAMRPPHRTAIAVISLVFAGGGVLAGCAGVSSSSSSSPSTTEVATPEAGVGGQVPTRSASGHALGGAVKANAVGQSVSPAAPLVIRTGTVTLGVPKPHIVEIFNRVSNAATSMGGFVASSSSNEVGDASGAELVVRVPGSDFGALVARVDSFGKVQAQSENGQDVTGESIDIEASLANLNSEENALRALLSRAGSIPAILQVQDQLFGVEGDIEQLDAQESSLIDRATFATLTVQLSPLAPHLVPKPKPKPENAFVRAAKLAAHNTTVAVRAVVVALGWAFPLIVLSALALAGWRMRRRVGRRQPPAPSMPTSV